MPKPGPTKFISIDGGKVRLSDSELHRLACKAIWESNHIVFESMPGIVAQIIEKKTWKRFQHKDFASYALDATSHGLGINTNQRLWMLRCAMDVHGKHIKEWAEVLAKVEEMVKLNPVAVRGAIGGKEGEFSGNSLERHSQRRVYRMVHWRELPTCRPDHSITTAISSVSAKTSPTFSRRLCRGI